MIACFKKVERHTWQQVEATAGGKKSGLGYTRLKRNELPDRGRRLSEDARDRVFELRLGLKGRVLCFRDDRVCHVVWFDPNHKITG